MKCSVLASGSSGNSVLIQSPETKVLIDVGLSGHEMASRLKSIGVSPDSIKYIILNHEHSDHIKGAGIYARKFRVPVYLNSGTYKKSRYKMGRIDDLSFFESDKAFDIEDMTFEPFLISHDASSPVGFCIYYQGKKIGLATDLGVVTKLVEEKLKKSDMLIIESNHDEEMLITGPYPWFLKQRIRSNVGHLSNTESNELLESIWHDDIKHIFPLQLAIR